MNRHGGLTRVGMLMLESELADRISFTHDATRTARLLNGDAGGAWPRTRRASSSTPGPGVSALDGESGLVATVADRLLLAAVVMREWASCPPG